MKLNILSLILVMSAFSFGQITVTSTDVLAVKGNSAVFDGDTTGFINVSPGPAGPNQTWDFTSLDIQNSESTVDYVDPVNTPYPHIYPNANFVRVQRMIGDSNAVGYGYYEVSPSAIKFNGFVFEADTTFFEETDGDISPLPLTYGMNWTTITKDTLDFIGFLMITKDSTYTEVDAWGTITLPAGSYATLRIRDNSTEYTQLFVGDNLISSDTTTIISYDWVTKSNFAVAFMQSQDGETDPNFSIAQEVEILKSTAPTSIANEYLTGPKIFELSQNYPNPFNPETVINFQMSQTENVRIDVYDINGKWITTLVDGQKSAGSYSTLWNGKTNNGLDVASGIYYYTLTIAGNNVQSRKMTLIR